MDKATLVSSIAKVAKMKQQAGFSVEHMIQLLNSGLSVEGLMDPITWRLERPERMAPVSCSTSRFDEEHPATLGIAQNPLSNSRLQITEFIQAEITNSGCPKADVFGQIPEKSGCALQFAGPWFISILSPTTVESHRDAETLHG